MHVHVSVLEFLVFGAYAIIFGFLWRSAAGALSERPLGKAMAAIF